MVGLVEVEFIKAKVTEVKFIYTLDHTRDFLICEDVVTELDHFMSLGTFLNIKRSTRFAS